MTEPDSPTRLRLFVALTVPEQVKARILEAQRRLQRVLPEPAARWTRPEQFHLTLRFLGNVDTAQTAPLADALRGACNGFGVLRLRASGIGFFPRPRSPRVVWAGVHDEQERLPGLWAAVQTATNAFTSEESERNFTGHITLARIKSIRPKEAEALSCQASELGQAAFGEWTSSEVEIIRSQLSPHGARYTTLAAIPLQVSPASLARPRADTN